jgi:hypothetical protein
MTAATKMASTTAESASTVMSAGMETTAMKSASCHLLSPSKQKQFTGLEV